MNCIFVWGLSFTTVGEAFPDLSWGPLSQDELLQRRHWRWNLCRLNQRAAWSSQWQSASECFCYGTTGSKRWAHSGILDSFRRLNLTPSLKCLPSLQVEGRSEKSAERLALLLMWYYPKFQFSKWLNTLGTNSISLGEWFHVYSERFFSSYKYRVE